MSLDLLIRKINDHVKTQEYAIIRKGSKQLKLKIFIKIILCYDCIDEWENKIYDYYFIKNKHIECSFKYIVKLNNIKENSQISLNSWILTMKYFCYNYSFIKVSIIYRKKTIQNVNILREIEKKFRKNNKINIILKELCLNQKNSIFKF